MLTEGKDGVCYQRVSLDDVLPGEEQLRSGLLGILQSAAEQENAHEADE